MKMALFFAFVWIAMLFAFSISDSKETQQIRARLDALEQSIKAKK